MSILSLLYNAQSNMQLHQDGNELFNQSDLSWDDFQNVLCELRCFVYGSKLRKDPGEGFLADARALHREWHLHFGLPACWALTEVPLHSVKKSRCY